MNAVPLPDAEKQVLGCTHAEVGAYLLGIWGLPHPIVESVAYHHRPAESIGDGFSALTAVHAADALAGPSQEDKVDIPGPQMDMAYVDRLGLNEHVGAWSKICQESNQEGGV